MDGHSAPSADAGRRHDIPHYEKQPDPYKSNSGPLSDYRHPAYDGAPPQYRDYGRQDTLISHSAIAREDDSGSDVSDSPTHPHMAGRFWGLSLIVPPPRPASDSMDILQAHLEEIENAENANSKQQATLLEKRRRKDDRLKQRRQIEDHKIEALHAARRRHDERVQARRLREDDAFEKSFRELDDAEASTRHRMKRLKRGLPPDDNLSRDRSTASPSSPHVASRKNPAKRHQPNPPTPSDIIYASRHNHPHTNGTSNSTPSSGGPPPPPSYQFYGSNPHSYSVPYHHSYNYGGPPPPAPPQGAPSASPAAQSHALGSTSAPPSQAAHLQREVPSPTVNGHTSSASGTPALQPQIMHGASPNNGPSRQPGKEYDTRPPDPPRPTSTTSGFASVNMPQSSGFAPINPRGPGSATTYSTPGAKQASGPSRAYDPESAKTQADTSLQTPVSANSGGGKRTPSTTHPYSQSEAFANRHHHSERVDALGRGIWTSYGPNGGTKELPTGPSTEMYLRCNHDGCMRIDWRTVHGLQCHIVKSHEQPKGTIGSLEKALDRYGVAVSEVESHEEKYGVGSAGTMADPKNQKIKNKTREMQQIQNQQTHRVEAPEPVSGRMGYAIPSMSVASSASPPAQPAQNAKPMGIGFKPSAMGLGTNTFPNLYNRKSNDGFTSTPTPPGRNHWADEEREKGEKEEKEEEKPARKFGVVWGNWGRVGAEERENRAEEVKEKKAAKEDEEMYDAPPATVSGPTGPMNRSNAADVPPEPSDPTRPVTSTVPIETRAETAVLPESAAQQAPSSTIPSPSVAANEGPAESKREMPNGDYVPPMTELSSLKDGDQEEKPTRNGTSSVHEVEKVLNGVQKDKEGDVQMSEEAESITIMAAATASIASPVQPAAPPPAAMSSPRSTRKPSSRRASSGVNKMEMDVLEAQDKDRSGQQSEDGDEGSRAEDGDADTIVSTGGRDREDGLAGKGRETRTTRQSNGRFRRGGRR